MTNRVPVACFATGTVAYFDEAGHTYIDGNGEFYLSGSTYAGLFGYEFDKGMILPRSAKRLGVDKEVVDAFWTSKAVIATSFGTALHAAMEHYGKYLELSIKDGKGLGIHPTLEPIVLDFFKDREHEVAVYEPFISDELNLRCGFIDRLLITGHKRCIIEDFKTNGDIYKKGRPAKLRAPHDHLPNQPISKYVLQLSFYQEILEAAGWTVEGRRLHWWAGKEWQTIELERVDILDPELAPEFAAWVE